MKKKDLESEEKKKGESELNASERARGSSRSSLFISLPWQKSTRDDEEEEE